MTDIKIKISEKNKKWIKQQVEKGYFESEDSVILEALELLAYNLYRAEKLTISRVAEIFRLNTQMQIDAFLNKNAGFTNIKV